jgi:uncharacterized protein
MSPSMPLAPLSGMSPFLYLLSAVVLGISFGFFLERAGFGSAKNLSSIFILRDFRVFRVLFSAVITGMLGIQLLGALGVMELGLLEFDPTFFWAMLAGGVVFGVGFYVGGYCPGTAVVAVARGRWDGIAFLVGISLGIYGFALLFDGVGTEKWFADFFAPADATRQTIYGEGPVWPWILGLTVIAIGAFAFVPFVEKRFALKTVEQLEAERAGEEPPPTVPPNLTGRILKIGPALAGFVAALVVVLQLTGPAPIHAKVAGETAAATAVDEAQAPMLDPLSLAGWVVVQAHRVEKKEAPSAYVVDLRDEDAVARRPIPGAAHLVLTAQEGEARVVEALLGLDGVLKKPADRTKPIVLVDADGGAGTADLVAGLRHHGVHAMMLEGGFAAWQAQVLAEDAVWPRPAVRTYEVDEAAPERLATFRRWIRGTPPPVDIDAGHTSVRRWLKGERETLPPKLALPGAVLLPSRAATVVAKGGAGGGCG